MNYLHANSVVKKYHFVTYEVSVLAVNGELDV